MGGSTKTLGTETVFEPPSGGYFLTRDEYFNHIEVNLTNATGGANPLVICSMAVTTNLEPNLFVMGETCPYPVGAMHVFDFPNGLVYVSGRSSNFVDSLTFWTYC